MIHHLTKSLVGGGGVYAQRLSDALCAAGLPSAVLCADDGSLAAEGRLARLFDRGLSGFLHRSASRTMHSFLRQTRWRPVCPISPADAVHLHSVTGFVGGGGLLRMIPTGAKVFWTAHNPWLFTGGCVAYAGCDGFERGCGGCPILPSFMRPWARIEHRAKRRLARERQVVPIANSEWMAELLRRSTIYGRESDIPVVPPIVDALFRPGGDGATLRSACGIGPERFVVGLSARAVTDEGKGIRQFFASLPSGWAGLEEVTFLILGDGRIPLPPGADHRFVGHVEGAAELARHYRAMDLFVSPSSMETFGMALLEAQACGTPVAAFSTGGTPEAVCPATSCRLVPNGDFAALFQTIDVAISARGQGGRQGDELHRWVAARHDAQVIAEKQIAIYHRHGWHEQ